ncbi:MAG: hypothetical protein II523_06390 [Bacteroidales bacterium]|nr:hypothetical protein [Bacteroidales bacterium]
MNDTAGIDDVAEVISIHPKEAKTAIVTGCRNRRLSYPGCNNTLKMNIAVKRIIIGSTGIESSMPGNKAISTAKGVSRAITIRPVSNLNMKSSNAIPANGNSNSQYKSCDSMKKSAIRKAAVTITAVIIARLFFSHCIAYSSFFTPLARSATSSAKMKNTSVPRVPNNTMIARLG